MMAQRARRVDLEAESEEALHRAVLSGERGASVRFVRQYGPVLLSEVRRHLSERLADYKVPRRIEFADGLPREETGKIFKRRLREPYWAGRDRRI